MTPQRSIVMVHGIGVAASYFQPLADVLSKRFRVYAPDLPGYGDAKKPPVPLSIPALADALRDYIRTNSIEQPVLIGHSMGCQIVAHVWRQEPKLVRKLILLAPTVNPHERTLPLQALRLLEDTLREPPQVNYIVYRDYFKMGLKRYLLTARDMIDDHIEETLSGCNVPVLLVRGERDKIVPHDWLLSLAQLLPNSQLYERPDQPHIVQWQRPEELAHVLSRHIES